MQLHGSQDYSPIGAVIKTVLQGNTQNFVSYLKGYQDDIHHFKCAIDYIMKNAGVECLDTALERGRIIVEFVARQNSYCECFQQLHADLIKLEQGQLRRDYPQINPALSEPQYSAGHLPVFAWASTTITGIDATNEQKASKLFNDIAEAHRARQDYSQSIVWLQDHELISPYFSSLKLMALNVVNALKKKENSPAAIEVASHLLELLRTHYAR